MRKILTNPPDRVFPTNDNVDGNLVVSKGDRIIKSNELHYMVIELLGTGTFGQVFRCVSNFGEEVALKIVKASNKYYQYSMNEVRTLKKLRDAGLGKYFATLIDAFIFQQHLCIVLDLLGVNMYELSRILRFRGLDYSALKTVLRQLLEALSELHRLGITHSDLKPENILISDLFHYKIKIIDFGSSTTRAISTIFYAQSRFYRAPEVILGIPYSSLIDVWSFGCIAYELYIGQPLFPGSDNFEQIHLINEFYDGGLPAFMVEYGENSGMFFGPNTERRRTSTRARFTFKDVIAKVKKKNMSAPENDSFLDMLMLALKPSYLERSLPQMLLSHPFFTLNAEGAVESPSRTEIKVQLPSIIEADRKRSMFDYGEREEVSARPEMRKGSVFDLDYENRLNRK